MSDGNLPRSQTNPIAVLNGPWRRLEEVNRVQRDERVGRRKDMRAAQSLAPARIHKIYLSGELFDASETTPFPAVARRFRYRPCFANVWVLSREVVLPTRLGR